MAVRRTHERVQLHCKPPQGLAIGIARRMRNRIATVPRYEDEWGRQKDSQKKRISRPENPRGQDQCCWLTVAKSKLHCHISEFRDGVHVARRAKLRGRDFQSGMAHAAAVMDIYLTDTDPHFLVPCAGRVL